MYRLLREAPIRVAGRMLEGTIAVGDVLGAGESAIYVVEQIDVYGHSLPDVTAGAGRVRSPLGIPSFAAAAASSGRADRAKEDVVAHRVDDLHPH